MKVSSIVFLVLLMPFAYSHAQIAAFVSGKEIKSKSTISVEDFKKLEVSFKNPKIPSFIYGVSSFYVGLKDADNKYVESFSYRKNGSAAVEDFLTNSGSKKIKVFEDGLFIHNGNTLQWILDESPGLLNRQKVKVEILLSYAEEMGYQKYGDWIQLLDPLEFYVTMYDVNNLFLPYLDLSLDNSKFQGDYDLQQSGFSTSSSTEYWYRIGNKSDMLYSFIGFEQSSYAGLNPKELAEDFMHAAATNANNGFRFNHNGYSIEKYTMPWDNLNSLLDGDKYRLKSLNKKNNKAIGSTDLITLVKPIEVNGLKGYAFSDQYQVFNSSEDKWEDYGDFLIYFFEHPTRKDVTLCITNYLSSNYNKKPSEATLKSDIESMIRSIHVD